MTANVKSTDTTAATTLARRCTSEAGAEHGGPDNQDKVSFQFLTYTQVGEYLGGQEAGRNRFQY